MKRLTRVLLLVTGLVSATALAQDGSAVFSERCASCHDGGLDRAPSRASLGEMSAERVLAAMETGPMISMASGRSAADRRAIAEFITKKKLTGAIPDVPSPQAMCPKGPSPDFSKILWDGWGQNKSNTRFQATKQAGITAAQVPRLKVKWAFGFPG
ncbi:MAG TPA: c-type cytochrome, partial [Terriglobia bacterium]|nr:c-type cytochrome [Terriglobia bacterium]